jgi:ectoine hydroxylase
MRRPRDPYATRVDASGAVTDRPDPVVWGSAAGGPLTVEDVARYEEDGFVVLPGLLGADDAEALREHAEELAWRMANADAPEVVFEPGGEAIRSLFAVHRHSDAFAALARTDELAGAARQLLGGDVYIHQARVNFKPGFDGAAFDWHSDFETWHAEDGMARPRALSASVLLTDNEPASGPLLLIPGSHRRFVRCAGPTPPEHYRTSLRRQEVGVPPRDAIRALADDRGITAALGPAGAVVLFDSNTLHASGGNLSPAPRTNLFLVYNSVDNPLEAPASGVPPRPEFIAERHPVPLAL